MAEQNGKTPAGLSARYNAIKILSQIFTSQRTLDELINTNSGYNKMSQRDRAFVRLILATTLRRLGQIDELLKIYLKRPLPKKARAVRDILRIGIAQIICLKTPAHAVVDISVRLCVKTRNPGQKGLVNAVLRKVDREGEGKFLKLDPLLLNTPKWLWNGWINSFGEQTCRAIAKAHLCVPPLNLTVKDNSKNWAKILDAEILPTGSICLKEIGKVDELPGFETGEWWVQDTAAALPARILLSAVKRNKNPRLLDLCAAPGGKTAQLVSGGAIVTALDLSKKRLKVLRQNLKRLKLDATIIHEDANNFSPPHSVDGILLDAPCTATGTIRRHPEILWTKKPDEIKRLVQKQVSLLNHAINLLSPDGILVYSVCSLQYEEGPGIIKRILDNRRDIKRLSINPEDFGLPQMIQTQDGDIQSLPNHFEDYGGMDGFYISCLCLEN